VAISFERRLYGGRAVPDKLHVVDVATAIALWFAVSEGCPTLPV